VALIDDDGQTLWVSPTAGKPLNIEYLPAGVQILVALRPEALANHSELDKILASLGPIGHRALLQFQEILLVPKSVRQCVIGFVPAGDGHWRTAMVAQLTGHQTATEHLATKLPDARVETHGAANYRVVNDWAYYAPNVDRLLLVVAPRESIAEIIDLGGDPPPLRREVARLLAHTDADRHLTVIAAPNSLFSEGQALFSGRMDRLRDPLFWFLGDELGAVALSLHWNDNFFVELVAVPTLETSPERAARILAERVAQIPDHLEEFVVSLNPHPYARRVVARFPAMARKLATYTRRGFEADHALLRCYLPAIAGHNLLMGTELTLAESHTRGPVDAPMSTIRVPPAETALPSVSPRRSGVREQLRRITSLSFSRDTLEAALDQLSQEIGVEIVILGSDLQAEGITKNQLFGIDLANKPAEEILVEILRLANPDKSASGPSDERQKLVYVISSPEDGRPAQILITTRGRAAERAEELPTVFQPR
jgi:hypothetical protein